MPKIFLNVDKPTHKLLPLLFLCVSFSGYQQSLHAADFISWQSANAQVLRGHDYELGPDRDRVIITFEYANK